MLDGAPATSQDVAANVSRDAAPWRRTPLGNRRGHGRG